MSEIDWYKAFEDKADETRRTELPKWNKDEKVVDADIFDVRHDDDDEDGEDEADDDESV